MKKIISFLCTLTLLAAVFSFAACKKNETPEPDTTTTREVTKSTTAEPVKIVKLPSTDEEKTEMLNAALDYVELYCYNYSKQIKCTVSDVSLGSLSAASNAADAFKSIFGETNLSTDYSYSTAPESFSDSFIKSGFTTADISSSEAKQDGENIVLTFKFKNETNPTDKNGCLHKLSQDYVSSEKITKSLSEFNSSATSVSVSASNITVITTISSVDSSLKKLVVSYNESFSLGGVKLVKLDGSTVNGKSATTVTFDSFK